jgi:hypothetical protein
MNRAAPANNARMGSPQDGRLESAVADERSARPLGSLRRRPAPEDEAAADVVVSVPRPWLNLWSR